MRLAVCITLTLGFVVSGSAQSPAAPPDAVVDKRALGVFPNYRLADANQPFTPISARRKMTIAAKDSVDFPVFIMSGLFSAIYQWNNSNPSFGQGMEGYAKRYATSYTDQTSNNFFIEGIFPSLLHEDPRYFRRGEGHGSIKSRLLYAATRVFVTRTDRGNTRFNFSEFLGDWATAGLGNAYYPDSRTFGDNLTRFSINVGSNALGAIAKEFSPDIKRALSRKRNKNAKN